MFDIVGNQLRAAGCILTQCDDSGSETQLARQRNLDLAGLDAESAA